jgi:hypothetical protein
MLNVLISDVYTCIKNEIQAFSNISYYNNQHGLQAFSVNWNIYTFLVKGRINLA